jgi:hypothetical protein
MVEASGCFPGVVKLLLTLPPDRPSRNVLAIRKSCTEMQSGLQMPSDWLCCISKPMVIVAPSSVIPMLRALEN